MSCDDMPKYVLFNDTACQFMYKLFYTYYAMYYHVNIIKVNDLC